MSWRACCADNRRHRPRSTADTAIEDVPDDFECPEAPECESRRTLKALWPEAHLETFDARECCESHAVLRELYAESGTHRLARSFVRSFVPSAALRRHRGRAPRFVRAQSGID